MIFGVALGILAMVADMLKTIKGTQDELLYRLKRNEVDQSHAMKTLNGHVEKVNGTMKKLNGSMEEIKKNKIELNFEVENMRVGDRTDYNKLLFDIETDGSVAPEEAFIKASQILVTQFGVFSAEEETAVETGNKEKKEEKSDSEVAIEEMKLSTRTLNALNKTEIKNAQDLSERSEDEISQIEGMGEKGIVEIKKALKKLGLGLKE